MYAHHSCYNTKAEVLGPKCLNSLTAIQWQMTLLVQEGTEDTKYMGTFML